MSRRLRGRIFAIPPATIPFPEEDLSVRVIATNGYCTGGLNVIDSGPAAGDDKAWIAWLDNAGGCNAHGIFNIKAQMVWNYATGTSDSAVTVGTVHPGSDDRHEAPSIIRNPSTGKLFITYGPISAASVSPFTSPFYRVSTNANSIDALDAETRVTGGVYMSEISLGYTSDGTLQMLGQGHNRFLNYYSLSSGGTWTATQGFIGHPTDTPPAPQGAPECLSSTHIASNNTIYLTWSRDVSGCSGSYKDIFLVKSTDNGANWTDVSGANSFARATKLTATLNSPRNEGLYDYPTAYRVHTGDINESWCVTALSTGRPVIVFHDSGGYKAKLYSGSGNGPTSFSTVTIDSGGTGNQGASVVVTSTDKLLAYGSSSADGQGNFVEYVSTNNGSSWTPTVLRLKGSEVANKYANARCYTNLGGKERVLVTWIQTTLSGTASNIIFMDRPQS